MLLELTNISKAFGPVQALRDVNLRIERGEVVALVGDNGAGKSTLIKIISGAHRPDTGSIAMDGEVANIRLPSDAAARGIETVYQDLSLCDNLDVVANLFLGHEATRGPGPFELRHLSEDAMEMRALGILAELKVTTLRSPRVLVGTLSGGQRQAVAIARAVLRAANLIILDEPTAALGVAQVAQVRRIIGELRGRNSAVLLISHNLEDVFATADRIYVLRLGQIVGDFDTKATSTAEVVSAITSGVALSSLEK
jgi:D-xylose transport system ATP-binding protein